LEAERLRQFEREGMASSGGSSSVPGTAARQNVTQRRSKDRFSDVGYDSPVGAASRRSNTRPKDRRYSLESEVDSHGANAVFHDRKHGEEFSGTYQPAPYSQLQPGARYTGYGAKSAHWTSFIPDEEEGKFQPRITRQGGRNDVSPDAGLGKIEQQIPSPQRDPPKRVGESGNQSSPTKSQDDDRHALFLRREIPSAFSDPDIHETLTGLWKSRQEASMKLVQALNEDDPDLFDSVEDHMRNLNRQMHEVMGEYQARENPGFVGVDDLPLEQSQPKDQDGQNGRQAGPKSHLKRSGKETGSGDFKIILNYQGNHSLLVVNDRTPTRYVYNLARDYLWEVLLGRAAEGRIPDEGSLPPNIKVDEIMLIHDYIAVPTAGVLGDIPIRDEAVLMMIYQPLRQQNQPSFTTPPHQRGDNGGAYPEGDHAGHPRDEFRQLYDARAPSQPGNNGGAYPGGDHSGHPRGEFRQLNDARAPSQPGNNGGAYLGGDHSGHPRGEFRQLHDVRTPSRPENNGGECGSKIGPVSGDNPSLSRSYDKIRQSFKCPRFSGQAREWKQWNKGFMRYLSIWELEYVLLPEFFDDLPLPPTKVRDNKIVYYIIEDSVQNSPLAASYVRQAPVNNGFEAYYTLHDGYVFAGSTTATLLLNELSNFRFLQDETPTELCLRLEELFEELELLPGQTAITFIDTQKIGYLVNALRFEKDWDMVTSAITSAQIKGTITFRESCDELRHRCETSRAHDLMDKSVKGRKVKGFVATTTAKEAGAITDLTEKVSALISTMSKRNNATEDGPAGGKKGKKKYVSQECLVADCSDMTTFPLCGVHYHSLVSAKSPVLKLRNGYGDATYDTSSGLIVYPPRTPADRLPSKPLKVKAGLAKDGE
jgi:hypothetical protein